MSGTREEGADRLRVGGWVPRTDSPSGGDAEPRPPADDPEPRPGAAATASEPAGDGAPERAGDGAPERAGDAAPEPPSGPPDSGPVVPDPGPVVPDPGPVPPGRPRPRFGVPAKVVGGAVAVVAILVLAVAAYQSMTRSPAAGPRGYGTEPTGSRVAVPPVNPSGVPAPSASPSGSPSASPSRSPASSPEPSPTGPVAVPAGAVANGGFESGTLAGWNCTNKLDRVVTSPLHSGRYALAGDPSVGRTAQCSQTVPVQPGKRYTLSGWVSGEQVYLGVSGAGLPESQAFTTSATYAQLQVTFVAPAGTNSVTIWVHGWYVPGTYYADDISLG
jgi:chitinase